MSLPFVFVTREQVIMPLGGGPIVLRMCVEIRIQPMARKWKSREGMPQSERLRVTSFPERTHHPVFFLSSGEVPRGRGERVVLLPLQGITQTGGNVFRRGGGRRNHQERAQSRKRRSSVCREGVRKQHRVQPEAVRQNPVKTAQLGTSHPEEPSRKRSREPQASRLR